ncbi:MAG TPA: hypothetical protein VL361_08085 [Candidatus Limnocylindrales bacterium]|jgi:CheY-like chemotaxis protein|nr:hypothetical protein [Candidatus Limnocylindrales bacterium]
MTQPLALVLYEKLLPGSQLVNRLQDLKYRVQAITDATLLVECAQQTHPMLVLADLDSTKENICAAVARLRQNPGTQHVPVLAFTSNLTPELQKAAETAGATLLVSEQAVLNHLGECLQQALEVK